MSTARPVDTTFADWPRWPQYHADDLAAVEEVLKSEEWGGVDASAVRRFENSWAEYLDVRFAKSCSNGTISLVMALQALGVGRGDEVIVPAYTFAATATAVLTANAVPVFVDVELSTGNIDIDAVSAAITPRTRAIIAVHVAGLPVDLTALTQLSEERGIPFIEDAAHAHGAEWEGVKIGGFGALASWSFQTSKNMTAGEGGSLTTNDTALAEAIDSLRNCGRVIGGAWYEHQILGANHRLSAMQSAVLSSALGRYAAQLERRISNAAILDEVFAESALIEPQSKDARVTAHAYHLYHFRYLGDEGRDAFVEALQRHNVPAYPGYPIPLYSQPVFSEYRFDKVSIGWDESSSQKYDELELPNTQKICKEAVWLTHPVLLADPDQIRRLADFISNIRL